MDKKTVLAVFLIFMVFYISRLFLPSPQTAQKIADEIQEDAATEQETPQEQQPETQTTKPIERDNLVAKSNVAINNQIILENGNLKLVFSNKGGVLLQAIIKGYSVSEKEDLVNLIKDEAFNITIDGKSYNNTVFDFFMGEGSITFYTDGVRKVFTLGQGYAAGLTITLFGGAINNYSIDIGKGIKDSEVVSKDKARDYGFITMVNNEIKKVYQSKLTKSDAGQKYEGSVSWVAAFSKYFAIGILPDKLIDVFSTTGFSADDAPSFSISARDNRAEFSHSYIVYLGTMETENMAPLGSSFEKIASRTFKALDWLSKFFIALLKWLYKLIPNYGVAIIIFAFFLKLILYPLTHKMYESTQKMQQIQPQIMGLQRKYKKDKTKLNVELRKLYKQHGVNPLGGCLPLLLQMPIFFALYPALKYSIGLRQASFGFWLKDLSVSDPYMILPIAMGAFMFLQQKLMTKKPSQGMDDKQKAAAQSQKIMLYAMPVLMIVIFRNLPAGLVLYWTVFNILSILQQIIINRRFKLSK